MHLEHTRKIGGTEMERLRESVHDSSVKQCSLGILIFFLVFFFLFCGLFQNTYCLASYLLNAIEGHVQKLCSFSA